MYYTNVLQYRLIGTRVQVYKARTIQLHNYIQVIWYRGIIVKQYKGTRGTSVQQYKGTRV